MFDLSRLLRFGRPTELSGEQREEIESVKFQARRVKEGLLAWDGWTPTAIELWNDQQFIVKRIDEQKKYLLDLVRKRVLEDRGRDEQRFLELQNAAHYQLNKFVKRLRELQ